jgi:tRNA1Val (adenine37-N6)-methyltransferase
MKVGTDAVLLGAWANIEKAASILDCGTGSGILALMAAQRNVKASITGIELDPNAADQASENCAQSPFKQRIAIRCANIFEFNECQFDAILCNPPFHAGYVLPPNSQRKDARHASGGLKDWFKTAYRLTGAEGTASFVLPYAPLDEIKFKMQELGWNVSRYCMVIPRDDRPPVRMLIELSKKVSPCERGQLQIETTTRGQYHSSYLNLVKDFYLFA